MRPERISLDTTKVEQPQGTYPYGKNGVRLSGVDMNENGFTASSCITPYVKMGIIETDTYPVYFSTDNTNSAFGFHDTDKDIYVPIFDDAALDFKLNFNLNRPIKGEYRRNFRNEIELSWIELADSGANPPRWANTVRIGTDPNDFLIFPKSVIPYVDTTIKPGGNLGMGAYFVGVKYIRNDGTETRYTTLTRPLIAFSDNYDTLPGGNTGKALLISITNIDQTYDRIGLVVVERINGVDTPYTLPELQISTEVNFTYTGAEKQEQLTLDEVLIPAAYYENAKAITQLTDQLFLADMIEEEVIDWQQYATMVKIRWKSELVNVTALPVIPTQSGKQRGYMHEEVYACYIVLLLKSGRNSRAFTCVGPAPQSSDLLQSAIATAQSLPDTPVYRIEDTCRNINTGDNTGDCGIWLNQDEVYPNIDQFNATAIGGEDLRGQPVRHHRMPSMRLCKQNFYNGNSEYGRTQLDTLGLEVTNVIIPAELQDKVVGWEIYYARRDFNNAMVLGQSLLLFGARANQDLTTGVGITSTGGNWGSYQHTHGSGSITDPESLGLTNNYVRFQAFDILFNRPSITPSHLSLQLYEAIKFNGTAYNVAVNEAGQVVYDLDYTNGQGNVLAPSVPAPDNRIYKVEGGQYMSTNTVSGEYSNIRLENAYVTKLPHPSGDLMNGAGWTWAKRDYTNGLNAPPQFEGTYLANLMILRKNVYISYFSPTLVRTGKVFPSTIQASDTIIYGGDTFLSVYAFNAYGLVTKKDVVNETGITDWKTQPTDGIKTIHKFICETVSDVACRYETPGNIYSEFWPKTLSGPSGKSFLYEFSRDNDPNQIGYSRDCNAVGDLLNGILTATPYDQFVSQSPTKIVRSVKQISESVINSWKNFNALDYYETVKNKGPITNLCGMNDRLIIHHRDAIYITRSKATFQGDITEITLGTGDIFQFDPNEVRPARLGYGGTSNPLACLLTPIGYIYPDNLTGELFLFDGGQLINIGTGLINFFLKYLTIKEINSYIGNGISVGYEQYYKRILLSVKNKTLSSQELVFVPDYQPTTEFFATLTANQSVVYKDGRYQLFKGMNSSEYECTPGQTPTLADYNFVHNEHPGSGTAIGTIAATGGTPAYSYILTTIVANRGGLGLDPLTGVLSVVNDADFDYTLSVLHLTAQVTDSNGNTDTGAINVTINQVASTPVLPAYTDSIPTNTPNSTLVETIHATDRDGKSITYSITAGNSSGAFAINSSTGAVTVLDNSGFDFTGTNPYILTIRATASNGSFDENTLTIYLTYVQTAKNIANVSEQADPYADANSQTKSNGIIVGDIYADGTQTYEVTPGLDMSIEAFCQYPTTGSNPLLRMQVFKNPVTPMDSAALVFDQTVACVPDASLVYVDVPADLDIYNSYVTSTADAPVDPISCGAGASYTGGEAFPTDIYITLGSATGNVVFSYDAFSIPDKFEVWYDGVKQIDTGYRGDTSYQSDLNANLAMRGLPPETIMGTGSGSTNFSKTTTSTTALVRVYGPLPDTSWDFTLNCPV